MDRMTLREKVTDLAVQSYAVRYPADLAAHAAWEQFRGYLSAFPESVEKIRRPLVVFLLEMAGVLGIGELLTLSDGHKSEPLAYELGNAG